MSLKSVSSTDDVLCVDIMASTSTYTPPKAADALALPAAPAAVHLSHPPCYDLHLAMHEDAAGQPSIELPSRPSLPPPEYSQVPETRAERLFWYGLFWCVLSRARGDKR